MVGMVILILIVGLSIIGLAVLFTGARPAACKGVEYEEAMLRKKLRRIRCEGEELSEALQYWRSCHPADLRRHDCSRAMDRTLHVVRARRRSGNMLERLSRFTPECDDDFLPYAVRGDGW